MIVLDTHALLWWALDPDELSAPAQAIVAQMESQGGFASTISIWEIGIKAKRGALELPIGIGELTNRIERSSRVELVPVDSSIWIRSLELPWEHRDPADRVIVATALTKQLPLLTKDEAIRRFEGVTTLW